MRVLITGAAGMLGRKLTEALIARDRLRGQEITSLQLVDIVDAPVLDRRAESIVADLYEPEVTARLAADRPDVVFHLAGVVSGEAEANRAKGYRVNLDGTRNLFDALAEAPSAPRVVFTSSIAVFGAPFPPSIPDDFHPTPLTSYGAQKAMAELLLADLSRRELIDGIGIRLPTITVRPGLPNAAASGVFSSIIREPLAGADAVLPVARAVRHIHASPRSAITNLVHAAEIDTTELGARRNLTMPSLSVTIGEQLEALARVAGPEALDHIVEQEDDAVATIIAGWPQRFSTERADALGFVCESSYDEIIETYLSDDAPTSA